MDRLERLGGNGLKNFMRVNFPRDVVLILDFWHASEYLSDLTKALHPDDEESRNDLLPSWCQTMKQKGGQGIVAVLDTLLLPPRTPSVQAQYETTLNYIRNNLHRMDYPTYVRQMAGPSVPAQWSSPARRWSTNGSS